MPGPQLIQVFISSTHEDLSQYRSVAAEVITRTRWRAVLNEDFGPKPYPTVAACLESIRDADLMLLLVAFRQGWVPAKDQGGDGESSITALELQEADRLGIPVLTFMAEDDSWLHRHYEISPAALEWVRNFRARIGRPAGFFGYEKDPTLPEFRANLRKALLDHKEYLQQCGGVAIGSLLPRLLCLLKRVSVSPERVWNIHDEFAPPKWPRLSRRGDLQSLLRNAAQSLAEVSDGTFPLLKFVRELQGAELGEIGDAFEEWLQWAARRLSDRSPSFQTFALSAQQPLLQQTASVSRLYALLIGISHYNAFRLANGSEYPNIPGSSHDIAKVEQFLLFELGISPKRLYKLTASISDSGGPPEPPDRRPTLRNIVAAFRELNRMSAPGDTIYIHYSGHGSRCLTAYPELKEETDYDSVLVPSDIGQPESRYLRDVELLEMLQDFADSQKEVTLVLDCPFSGGMTRTWRGIPPMPTGCTLIAASNAVQPAYEYPFEGKEPFGVLTYWLLDSLRNMGINQTCEKLHDRVYAKIKNQFRHQSPVIAGEKQRFLFGGSGKRQRSSVTVIAVDQGRVLLNAGQAHGVGVGARFLILPPVTAPLKNADSEIIIEIADPSDIGATQAWANIVKIQRTMIEQGWQAFFLYPGQARLKSWVRVVCGGAHASPERKNALLELEALISCDPSGFLCLGGLGAGPADFQIVVSERDEYEILDPEGLLLPGCPALPMTKEHAQLELVRRLIHLTRYYNLRRLDNFDLESPLYGKLTLGVSRSPFSAKEITESSFSVDLANLSSHVLNVVVVILRSDWSIEQVFPSEDDVSSFPLIPGTKRVLEICWNLPDGVNAGTEIIKAFGAIDDASFRWLELPPLLPPLADCPLSQPGETPSTDTRPIPPVVGGNLENSAYASESWIVAQVEVHLRRAILSEGP